MSNDNSVNPRKAFKERFEIFQDCDGWWKIREKNRHFQAVAGAFEGECVMEKVILHSDKGEIAYRTQQQIQKVFDKMY